MRVRRPCSITCLEDRGAGGSVRKEEGRDFAFPLDVFGWGWGKRLQDYPIDWRRP